MERSVITYCYSITYSVIRSFLSPVEKAENCMIAENLKRIYLSKRNNSRIL